MRLTVITAAVAIAATVFLAGCAGQPVAAAPYAGPVLQIEQLDRGVQITLPSTVLFKVGDASFNASESGPYLDRVADLLTRKTDKKVSVEGHTDSDGSATLNDTLSRARAQAIADALLARGVKGERLSTTGYSFNRPIASNATEDGKRLNRRVELIVLDEKVATLTQGEPAGAFDSAWARLKDLIDRGLVLPADHAASDAAR